MGTVDAGRDKSMTWNDLPRDLRDSYDWLDTNSKQAELEWDGKILRFKADPVIESAMRILASSRELNTLWIRSQGKPLEYMMDFYRKSGYSVSGFSDVFSDRIEHGDKVI
jgi:hypothetical protein